MTQRPHVGDIGTVFRFTCRDEDGPVISLVDSTVRVVRFKRPDRTTFDRDLVVEDEELGIARYVTVEGDLDQAGRWEIQAFLENWAGEWKSDIEYRRVYSNIPGNEA